MLARRCALLLSLVALIASGCRKGQSTEAVAPRRTGPPIAERDPTALYTAKFVIRGIAADEETLYVSGLDLEAEPPRGMVVRVPLLGMPETLAEGEFIPMTRLDLVDGRLYWHERHDSPSGTGLRSLATDGAGGIEELSTLAGHSWVIGPQYVYFTRPDDEIDEGGFYRIERAGEDPDAKRPRPKLIAKRRGVIKKLLAGETEAGERELYWTTRRRRKSKTWAVYRYDGEKSGEEILSSDETFASIAVDGRDFLWVTWAEDEGEPLHSLYRRAIDGGEIEVMTRKRGLPGFMEVMADDSHVYLGTVQGGELRRLPKAGGDVEILQGSGDRNAILNRYNVFWIDGQQVFWVAKS